MFDRPPKSTPRQVVPDSAIFFPDRARLRACDSDMAFPAHADHYNMLNVLPDFWVAETELWPYENDHFVLHICKLCGGKVHFAILLFPT